MPSSVVKMEKIVGSQISDDGMSVRLIVKDNVGGNTVVEMPTSQIADFVQSLIELYSGARSKQLGAENASAAENEQEVKGDSYLVEDVRLSVWHETDGLTLQIQDARDKLIQLFFRPNHLQFLVEAIQLFGKEKGETLPH